MSDRLTKIGIKQVIRYEWMERTLQLLLADQSPEAIRTDLLDFLDNRKQSGGIGDRGKAAVVMAVQILMNAWVIPDQELIGLRDACLDYSRHNSRNNLLLHWVMISVAYPFWFQTASVVGRLSGLQEVISKQQVMQRLKGIYGDRQTISRYARYVIRSYIAWNILVDTDKKGFYETSEPFEVNDPYLVSLLYECHLQNTENRKLPYEVMVNSPAFFHFLVALQAPLALKEINPRLSITSFSSNEHMFSLT